MSFTMLYRTLPLAMVLAMSAHQAHAQLTPGKPNPTPAPPTNAPAEIIQDPAPGQPLSDKLKEGNGVLKPSQTIDSEIQKSPPVTSDTMPVIKPDENGKAPGVAPTPK